MPLSIIELNDSEIRVASGTDIILRDPGYAVIRPDRIETGADAWKIARNYPRETSNRYWSQLNQDSLITPSRLARHNADLAYAQLVAIHGQAGKPEEVLFAVPGNYSRDQLSLLLGIVQACPFSAVGLVDSAIATASALAGPGKYIYLDIHLHNTVITTLDVSDKVSRMSVKVVDNNGTSDIYDTCAGFISDQFIDQSRFDPLRHGESEQSLYELIPQCLSTLKTSGEASLEILYNGKRYQAKIFKVALLERLQSHYEKIYRELEESTTKLISDRLAMLPGFADNLRHMIPVDEKSVFKGCQMNLMTIRSSGPSLSFITTLPATKSPIITISKQQSPKKTERNPPQTAQTTHVLINNRAYPLNGVLYLSANGNVSKSADDNSHCSVGLKGLSAELKPVSNLAVYINGNRVSSAVNTVPGDTVSFAGSDTIIRFIEVTGN